MIAFFMKIKIIDISNKNDTIFKRSKRYQCENCTTPLANAITCRQTTDHK